MVFAGRALFHVLSLTPLAMFLINLHLLKGLGPPIFDPLSICFSNI